MHRGTIFAVCLVLHAANAQQASIRIPNDVIQQRLGLYKGNDTRREGTLRQLFQDAGCAAPNLVEQAVPGKTQPNVICTLPGATAATLIVGAHFDHVDNGDGVIDNWSGASLLPSLFQILASAPRQHTFIFVGFAGEESGLVGSKFYVKHLSAEQIAHVEAMINLDTLGLGPAEVWVSQSDPRLVNTIAAAAHLMKLPLAGMNLNGLGESDEESFIAQNICTLSVHSLTAANAHVLHRPEDNPTAVHPADYYDTFRLLAAYLPALDGLPFPAHHVCTVQAIDAGDPSVSRQWHHRIGSIAAAH